MSKKWEPLKDAPKRSLLSSFARKAEIYPMAMLGAGVVSMMVYGIVCHTEDLKRFFRRISSAPFDWEQIRDSYYSRHTTLLDPDGSTHQRLKVMEQLKDTMLVVSKNGKMKNA